MSVVERALNVEVPLRWADNPVAPASPVSRWGQPIWAAEEPIARLQNAPEALPLNIAILAVVFSRR